MTTFHIISEDKEKEFLIDAENKVVRYRIHDEDDNGYKLKIECEAPIPLLPHAKVEQWSSIAKELGMDGSGPINVKDSSKALTLNEQIAGCVEKRLSQALLYSRGVFRNIGFWVANSREISNYTYDIRDTSYIHFKHAIALVTGSSPKEIGGYLDEVKSDIALNDHFHSKATKGSYAHISDSIPRFGRRLMWYALVD